MRKWKSVIAASLLAVAASTSAFAERTDLVLGVVLEPPHLDPTTGAAGATDEVVYANIFEGLTRIGSRGEVLPALAKSWEVSEDGKTYIFKLHEGVKFHDGTDFNAEDVKFSLDRARSPDSVNAQKVLFEAIEKVEVIDPATIKIILSRPQGAFLYNMGWGDAVIVAPESADQNKEKPIGTGPFKFENWAKGSSIRLVKSPDYWGDPVYLDKVEFRVIPDAAAAIPAMLSGDVQAFPMFPQDSVAQIESDPRFKVVIGSTEGETILSINNKKAPFDNKLVRQAISHLIDRPSLIEGASAGFGTPIGSHFAPHSDAYIDLTGTYPYDVEKAKERLKQAGFENGFSTTLKLPPTPYARQAGEIMASEMRKVGINAEIIPLEWAQWLDQVFKNKDFDLTIISHTEPNDIEIYARPNYYFGYSNPEFDKLIAELDITADVAKRKELYSAAQKILAEDAVVGFMFQLPKIGIWDAKLEGLWENLPIQANDLTKVRWTE